MPTSHPSTGESDPEALVTCPYNASHRIARKRVQFHLTKCRKGHPNAKKEVCPYNSTHMVNEQEFKFHQDVCPNKGIIDNFKYSTSNETCIIEPPPEPVLPPAEEDWDNDYSGTYEPALKVRDAPIVHNFIGGTRSERKRCRIEQRQKFRALGETGPVIKIEPKQEQSKPISDDKPLRQPISLLQTILNKSAAAKLSSSNRSIAPGTSMDIESISKPRGVSGIVDMEREQSALFTRRTPLTAGIQSRPGPSTGRDDEFIRFKPKGRGEFRN